MGHAGGPRSLPKWDGSLAWPTDEAPSPGAEPPWPRAGCPPICGPGGKHFPRKACAARPFSLSMLGGRAIGYHGERGAWLGCVSDATGHQALRTPMAAPQGTVTTTRGTHCPQRTTHDSCASAAPTAQGLLRELSPGPLAPEARIMPLDQAAFVRRPAHR